MAENVRPVDDETRGLKAPKQHLQLCDECRRVWVAMPSTTCLRCSKAVAA